MLNDLNMMLFDIEGKAEVRNTTNSSPQGKKRRNPKRSVQQSDIEGEEKDTLTSHDPRDKDEARAVNNLNDDRVVDDMNEEAEVYWKFARGTGDCQNYALNPAGPVIC